MDNHTAASGALALRPGGVDETHDKHELFVSSLGERATTNYFALTAYDAVWSLAHAMQAAKDAGESIQNGTALLHHLRGVEFEGASGNVRFDQELDRIGGYDLVQVGTPQTHLGFWNGAVRQIEGLSVQNQPGEQTIVSSGASVTLPKHQPCCQIMRF